MLHKLQVKQNQKYLEQFYQSIAKQIPKEQNTKKGHLRSAVTDS